MKLYLIFTWITLTRLLKTFAIKNKVITFKNVKSNWEFCSTFISLIKIVEHKKHRFPFILFSEAATRGGVLLKKVFLVIWQNSRKTPEACNFIKKRLWHRCFPVYFAKFLKTPFLTEHFRWLLLSLLVLLYSWGTKIRKFITFYFHSIRVARVWRLRSEFGEVGDWHFYQQKQSSSRVL